MFCKQTTNSKYHLALFWITASYITFSRKWHPRTLNHAHVMNDSVQHEFQEIRGFGVFHRKMAVVALSMMALLKVYGYYIKK